MRLKEISSNHGFLGANEVTFEAARSEVAMLEATGFNHDYKVEIDLGRINKFNKKGIKVIFNNPATILFIDGKKYVSKAHDEEFDEEKGLLMCLAKAQGISHLELKRMIKGAERPSKPLPPKERKSINGVSIRIEKLELAKKRGRPKKTKEGD